jgi:hypothetical protein
MTAQQRDMVDQILRNAPFNLGGDVPPSAPSSSRCSLVPRNKINKCCFAGGAPGGSNPEPTDYAHGYLQALSAVTVSGQHR